MNLTNKIFFVLIILNSIIFSQTYEEIIKLRNQYDELKAAQAKEFIAEEGKSVLKDEEDTGPTRILYKPEDLEEFYRVQLTQLTKSIEEINKINSFFDSTSNLKHYGYDLFTNRDTVSFFENMTIPNNYVLGNGDEIVISLWGEVEKVENTTINKDGNIFLEDIGIIGLGGISLSEAKLKVKNSYSKIFSTVKGSSPSTFVNITLGQLKGLNVHILGFVKFPGIYPLNAFADPFTALFYAGGIDTTGSLRDIQIFRNNSKIASIDLYNIIHDGLISDEIRLLDKDIIFVPPRKSKVIINGEVLSPGYFELLENETAEDLIDFSGGLNPKASNLAMVKRISSPYNRINDDKAIEFFSLSIDSMDKFIIMNGDSLGINSISDFHPTVSINGWVKRPGEYPYINGMTIYELIEMGGGLFDKNWKTGLDEEFVYLNRYNDAEKNTNSISLTEILTGKTNPKLNPFDEVRLNKNNNNNFSKYIHLTGEVKSEGIYLISNRSIDEIIEDAGGLTNSAFIEGIELYRDSIRVGLDNLSLIPIDGDSIHIPYPTGSVTILGSVNNPGPVSFVKGLSVNEFINLSGGYTIYANKKDVFVIYPNGIARKKTKFFSPKVIEGSTIMVSSSQLVIQQTDYLEVTQQIASVISSLATVALIINTQK